MNRGGNRSWRLPLSRKHGGFLTGFAEKIYAALRPVPRGKVVTYAALAKAISKPRASRAVGNALNKNPYAPQVPCHRVVKSNGELGGFASGSAKKEKMLRAEGVEIKNGRIDLRRFGYKF